MAEHEKAHETFQKFNDVRHLMHMAHHCRKAKGGPCNDPTRGRGRILALLKLKDGIATREMAQILGIRVSSLNETLAKLEKEELIERTPSNEDKRIMLVALTEKGAAEAQKPTGHFPDKVFADFTDEELEQFSQYLDRIAANIEAGLGDGEKEKLEEMRQHRAEFFAHHAGHGGGCHGGQGHHHMHHASHGCGEEGGHPGHSHGPGHGHGGCCHGGPHNRMHHAGHGHGCCHGHHHHHGHAMHHHHGHGCC